MLPTRLWSAGLLASASAVIGGAAAGQGIAPPSAAQAAAQLAAFEVDIPGSIYALQPFRNEQTVTGADGTVYRLISLNPHVNSWFVLEITPQGGRTARYHLENADEATWSIALEEADGTPELVFISADETTQCQPWTGALAEARGSGLPYAPICDWQVFLRNATSGSQSSREAVSQFLRDNVVFGDSIVNLIKGALYEDAFMISSEDLGIEEVGDAVDLLGQADLDSRPAMGASIGYDLEGVTGGVMQAGAWYAVEDAPGIYASVMQPGQISGEILGSGGVNWLDGVENWADVNLVAFDMSQFEIGYEVGTEHPRVNWSPRPSGAGRHYNGNGPDGFGGTDPIVRVGMLSPSDTDRVVASFTGGFKREHGAWRFGPRAQYNWGHHYGFMQNGVILSRLWPELSTLYMLDDGTIGMTTWPEDDSDLLPRLVFARQNGVPLIENGVPGDQVTSWGGGNWSGSAEANLRTLRSGVCLREIEGRQFLIYAYFSSATPSAMARVFQAYRCDYAMLLDMNSPELTYSAVYFPQEDGEIRVEHLSTTMTSVDQRRSDGTRIPRFVSYADNRDFFFLLRREE